MKFTWYFSFSILSVLTTLLVFSILVKLGLWQLQRADEKRLWLAKFEQQQVLANDSFDFFIKQADWPKLTGREVSLSGGNSETVWLLDNQVFQARVGYAVISKLTLSHSAQPIWVNWGWIKAPKLREQLPIVELPTEVQFSGVIKAGAFEQLVLASANHTTNGMLTRIQAMNYLFEQYPDVPPVVVYANKGSVAGIIQNYQPTVMPPEKHLAYALQWFLLAAASVLVFIFASVKRKSTASAAH